MIILGLALRMETSDSIKWLQSSQIRHRCCERGIESSRLQSIFSNEGLSGYLSKSMNLWLRIRSGQASTKESHCGRVLAILWKDNQPGDRGCNHYRSERGYAQRLYGLLGAR